MVVVPHAGNMSDDTLCSHLEARHADSLALKFLPEPGRTERRLRARGAWLVFHQYLHEHKDYQHDHKES